MVISTIAYLVAIALTWCLSAGMPMANMQESEDETDPPDYLKSLRFASAHIITMSFGSVMPTTDMVGSGRYCSPRHRMPVSGKR